MSIKIIVIKISIAINLIIAIKMLTAIIMLIAFQTIITISTTILGSILAPTIMFGHNRTILTKTGLNQCRWTPASNSKIKTKKKAVVEYLDYQTPVTQLKGRKGKGDMHAPPTGGKEI